MCSLSSVSSCVFAIFVTALAPAQTRHVVAPTGYGATVGEGRVTAAFESGYQREATLYDRSVLGFGPATILELAWRRASGVDPIAGHTASVVARLAHSSQEPETMTYRFSRLLGSAPRVVFSGNLSLPAAAPGPGPHAFAAVLPLAAPFTFDPALGNLVVDLEVQNPLPAGWPRDARDVVTGTAGSFRQIAAPCTNSMGFPMTQRPTALDNCAPGRLMQIWAAGTLPTSASVVHWIGIALAQPFELTSIGAPGCTFAVEPFAVMPPVAVFPATTSFGYAWAEHRIPALPGLAGARLATQWAEFDAPPGNTLGVVFSDAIEVTLGSAATAGYSTKTMATTLQGSDIGRQLPGDRGAITRFGLR